MSSLPAPADIPLGMLETDLVFSLGPNCRSTWNLRQHFGTERAYPFDWWITPARSMLRMLDPSFHFKLDRNDLHIAGNEHGNSVYNARYNLLHHHDFPRQGAFVRELAEDRVSEVEAKYRQLFQRLHEDVARARRPVAFLNGSYAGWPDGYHGVATAPNLNQPIKQAELAAGIRQHLGPHLQIVFINIGPEKQESFEWGHHVMLPDHGEREAPKGAEYAEPVHVFRAAYERLKLRLAE